MKILILSTFERTGGAAVAANRLMKALRKEGHDAKMLVCNKQTDDLNVLTLNTSWWKKQINFIRKAYERWVIFVHNRFSRKNLWSVSIANTGTDISRHPLVKEADIIHLHWINQGFLSLPDIKELVNSGKPIVWTLHDLWAGTGICHYPGNCIKHETACKHCEMLSGYFLLDLSQHVFIKKQKTNLHLITYVGCSRWIAEKAKQSALLKNAEINSIPNPIDTKTFCPQDKLSIRKRLGLPPDKKLILFSAAKISDIRKGGSYFVNACNLIGETNSEWKNKTEIVLMGGGNETFFSRINLKVNPLRYVSGDKDIAAIYAAVDLFVIPSLEDNLPNTIMEAMACGTPCAGFNIGGIPEMIDHKKNGYIAEYQNAADLANGISWCLENHINLTAAARNKVLECYSEDVIAQKYIELYSKLINKKF
jgi:glycosyltransferase involved in cell wall biosynthesis